MAGFFWLETYYMKPLSSMNIHKRIFPSPYKPYAIMYNEINVEKRKFSHKKHF